MDGVQSYREVRIENSCIRRLMFVRLYKEMKLNIIANLQENESNGRHGHGTRLLPGKEDVHERSKKQDSDVAPKLYSSNPYAR